MNVKPAPGIEGGRASVVEDRPEVEPAEALGVGQYVDLDDLPAGDREAHDRERLSPRARYGPRGPVHGVGWEKGANRE